TVLMTSKIAIYSQPLLALALFVLPVAVKGLGIWQLLLGLLLAYSVYFFDSSQYEPGRRYHPRIYNWIRNADARMLSGYFQKVSLTYEDFEGVKKHPQVIYSIQPHGVMSYCPPMLFMNAPQKTCGLGASVCFKFPVMREMYLWMGVIDAGRPTCMKALKEGYSLSIVLGGTKEQLIPYSPTHDTIVCKSRRGFIYLARDAGKIPIVPCYCFGEQIAFETSDFMLPFRQWLQHSLGMGLPLPKSLRPKNLKDFALVVGKPIEWDEDDTVETMHAKYVSAIHDLFYSNRSKYPEYEKRELVIQ
ncbi:hypothetical protein FOL47_003076, partial [Perkinsus chesapeaki]